MKKLNSMNAEMETSGQTGLCKKCTCSAFTLAEMMVVMLILSIIMAAFAPVMTTRSKTERNSPWRYASNNFDIYYGLGLNSTALIGQPEKKQGIDPSTRLIINTSDSAQKHITFKRGENNVVGSIHMSSPSSILIGSSDSPVASQAIAIGNKVTVTTSPGIAIGEGAESKNNLATALGFYSKALNTVSTSLGSYSSAEETSSTAVGYKALASGKGSSAFGANANTSGEYSTALGYEAKASGANSTAIGTGSEVINPKSIAIGTGALSRNEKYTSGGGGIALGSNAAAYDGGISIGENSSSNTTVTYYKNGSVSLGRNTDSYDSGIAIGEDAAAGGRFASGVAIGRGANARATNSGELGGGIAIGLDSNAVNGAVAIGFASVATPQKAYANNAAVAIGMDVKADGSSVAVGSRVQAFSSGVAIGNGATAFGENNIAIGEKALANNLNGKNNIAIGANACENVTGTNKICIGNHSGPGVNNPDNDNDEEHIYIGSASKGNTGGAAVLEVHNPGGSYGSYHKSAVVINGNLVVNGLMFSSNRRGGGGPWEHTDQGDDNGHSGHIIHWNDAGGYYSVGTEDQRKKSDMRLKYVGKEVTTGLEKIKQLKVFNYTFKKDEKKTPHVGVIAQDLQKVFPDAVKKDEDGYLSIRWEDMFYAVINAVKELDAKITNLTEQLKIVQEQNKQIIKQNKEIETRLKALETAKK